MFNQPNVYDDWFLKEFSLGHTSIANEHRNNFSFFIHTHTQTQNEAKNTNRNNECSHHIHHYIRMFPVSLILPYTFSIYIPNTYTPTHFFTIYWTNIIGKFVWRRKKFSSIENVFLKDFSHTFVTYRLHQSLHKICYKWWKWRR